MTETQYYGTGRRKTSTARVYLRSGSGAATINGRPIEVYFPNDVLKMVIRQPLLATETADRFDVLVLCDGGGFAGQADATRLGIAGALVQFNAELRGRLKSAGYLTRDPRAHERKKYGQKGARKRFQFSKR